MKRSFHALRTLLLGILGLFATAGVCRADGFIIIHNPPPSMVPGHFAFAPL
ncbi:MAG: hypothetical protein JWL69_3560, partial [Phycisphaerales bacterium]|nr:hypothetical protein [Phycisphaerales bacterium]